MLLLADHTKGTVAMTGLTALALPEGLKRQ
jgi:hypothetical protein